MRIIKRILIFLFSILALILIVALFVDTEYTVERTVEIDQPRNATFDYLVLLKNQDDFSVWSKMDPNMKKTYTGTDGTVGFVSAWKSTKKDVGSGEQEIKGITPKKRIDYEIRFKEPFETSANSYIETSDTENNATKVTWGMSGSTPYPFNIFHLFMNMDKMLGKDLEDGLKNLKTTLEERKN